MLDSNKTIYVYDANRLLFGSWTATDLTTPTGIAVSGSDVWIVDSGSDRAYRHVDGTKKLSGSFVASNSFALAAGNGSAGDLVTDGTAIWVTQSNSTDRVYVYSMLGTSLGNWTLPTGNTSPVGITIDPTGASQSLWIVDNTSDQVFEYANARSRLSGTQPAAATFALHASNTNAQAITDPRVLSSLDEVFASDDILEEMKATDSSVPGLNGTTSRAFTLANFTQAFEIELLALRQERMTSVRSWRTGSVHPDQDASFRARAAVDSEVDVRIRATRNDSTIHENLPGLFSSDVSKRRSRLRDPDRTQLENSIEAFRATRFHRGFRYS